LKLFFFIIIATIFLVSCGTGTSPVEPSVDKVKHLIKLNKALLLNNLKTEKQKSFTGLESAVTFIKKIESGICENPTEKITLAATFSVLNSFTYVKANEKKQKAIKIVNCLSSLKLNKEELYIPLVLTLVATNKDFGAFKLLYENLFVGYSPAKKDIFGLMAFARLECNQPALKYLEKQGYLENSKQLFTNDEYQQFKQTTDRLCSNYN